MIFGSTNPSITNVNPGFIKIPKKKRINRFIEFGSRHYVNAQSFSPFGSGESHHRKNPRETPQPAPRCGRGTARSSAEPDESRQGSAHGNLGDLMTKPAESGRCRKRVMACLKKGN